MPPLLLSWKKLCQQRYLACYWILRLRRWRQRTSSFGSLWHSAPATSSTWAAVFVLAVLFRREIQRRKQRLQQFDSTPMWTRLLNASIECIMKSVHKRSKILNESCNLQSLCYNFPIWFAGGRHFVLTASCSLPPTCYWPFRICPSHVIYHIVKGVTSGFFGDSTSVQQLKLWLNSK